MTPIEKNIAVVDEQGNQYEATYPKRAKGLVKNGRARFIDEHTICLACPPDTKTEDISMTEHTATTETTTPRYTVEYILEQIEKIAADTAYLHEAIKGAVSAGEARAIGLGNIVESRENTNRKLIAFYEKIYDDLKPEKATPKLSPKEQALQILAAKAASGDLSGDEIQDILGTIRFLD